MSEPRKLYTGSASGGLDQEQYEAARRRAHAPGQLFPLREQAHHQPAAKIGGRAD